MNESGKEKSKDAPLEMPPGGERIGRGWQTNAKGKEDKANIDDADGSDDVMVHDG